MSVNGQCVQQFVGSPNTKGGEKRLRELKRPARNLKCLRQGKLGRMPDERLMGVGRFRPQFF